MEKIVEKLFLLRNALKKNIFQGCDERLAESCSKIPPSPPPRDAYNIGLKISYKLIFFDMRGRF